MKIRLSLIQAIVLLNGQERANRSRYKIRHLDLFETTPEQVEMADKLVQEILTKRRTRHSK